MQQNRFFPTRTRPKFSDFVFIVLYDRVHDFGVEMIVLRQSRFSLIKNFYVEKCGLKDTPIRLSYEGRVIEAEDTPRALELVDEDVIMVELL